MEDWWVTSNSWQGGQGSQTDSSCSKGLWGVGGGSCSRGTRLWEGAALRRTSHFKISHPPSFQIWMGLISSGLRLPGRARPPTGGKAGAGQRGWRQLLLQRGTSFSCSRGLHRTLWTADQRRGGGGCKTAPLGLRFFRSKPESQCVHSLRPQETCPSQLQSEAKGTVKTSPARQFPSLGLHNVIKLHQHLFRGPDLNHPGGLWLNGGISMSPDSLKDIWARLVCVSPALPASDGLVTGTAPQGLYKFSLQGSCHGVLYVVCKPLVFLAFLGITGIGCQSFPNMLCCLNFRSPQLQPPCLWRLCGHMETPTPTGSFFCWRSQTTILNDIPWADTKVLVLPQLPLSSPWRGLIIIGHITTLANQSLNPAQTLFCTNQAEGPLETHKLGVYQEAERKWLSLPWSSRHLADLYNAN